MFKVGQAIKVSQTGIVDGTELTETWTGKLVHTTVDMAGRKGVVIKVESAPERMAAAVGYEMAFSETEWTVQAVQVALTNSEVKAEAVTVLDGTDDGFWGLAPGEHVVLLDGCMVHLDASNKVVAVEFTDDAGHSRGIVEVSGGVPTFPA
jgi:hypothetical protein